MALRGSSPFRWAVWFLAAVFLGPVATVTALERSGDRTALPTTGTDQVFTGPSARYVVTVEAAGARCAVPADFDGDGDQDLASVSSSDNSVAWYERLADGSYGPKKMVSRASNGARIVTVGDIDQDNLTDIIVASYYDHTVGWFRNSGSGFEPMRIITRTAIAAQGVHVADLDSDGDLDVLSASSGDDSVAWFENLGGGIFCEVKNVVDTFSVGVRTVISADLDGDGFMDLAAASKDDNTIAWYRNDGRQRFTKIVVDGSAMGAYSLVAADVDRDGHVDLVTAANADGRLSENGEGGMVSFYRNGMGGDGTWGHFTRVAVTAGNASGANDFDWFVLSVWAGDLDMDGDVDIASASFGLLHPGGISWYENVDGAGGQWTRHRIYETPGTKTGHYVIGADMDGDGDTDLVAVTNGDNKVQILTASTACDNSRTVPTSSCCTSEQYWNGTACVLCALGTFLGSSGVCEPCSTACPRPGLGLLPKSCHSIPSCADAAQSFARCDCGPRAFLYESTGVCAVCPDGQTTVGDVTRTPANYTLVKRKSALDGTSYFVSDLSWSGFNASRCLIPSCGSGEYFSKERQSCTMCGAGNFSAGGSVTECEVCPAGSFCAAGASVPTVCQAGNYSAAGASECSVSPPGTSTEISAMASPVPCAPGSRSARPGSVTCEACPIGEYAASARATACVSCGVGRGRPELWTTMKRVSLADGGSRWVHTEGAVAPDGAGGAGRGHCTCDEGGRMSEGGECIPCEDGLLCNGGGDAPLTLPGYHAGTRETFPSEAFCGVDAEYSVFKCLDARWCPGGAVGVCAPGREGIGCAACRPGMIDSSGGKCIPCESGDGAAFVLLCVFSVVIIAMLFVRADRDKVYRPRLPAVLRAITVSLIAAALQQMSVLGSLSVAWVDPLKAVLSRTKTLSLDLDSLGFGCYARVGPMGEYLIKIAFMAGIVGVSVLIFGVVVLVRHGGRFHEQLPTLVGVIGTVGSIALITIVHIVFEPFHCTTSPNRVSVMRSMPLVVCFESEAHTVMVAASLLASIAPTLFIAGVCWVTWRFPARMADGDVWFLRSFYFLVVRFRPEASWYGAVLIIRNATIALAPLYEDPVVQVILIVTVLGAVNLVQTRCLPWRLRSASYVDSVMSSAILLFMCCSCFLVADVQVVAVAWICLALLVFGVVAALGLFLHSLVWEMKGRSPRQYDYFLCRHERDAAAQARWLSVLLSHDGGTRVFSEPGDMTLDMLLDVVTSQVQHFVILLTKDTLRHPVCVGELVSAVTARVHLTGVVCPGWAPPTAVEMESPKRYLDDSTMNLMQFGITFEVVRDAFAKLCGSEVQRVTLPTTCPGRSRFDALASLIMGKEGGKAIAEEHPPVPPGAVVACCDDGSDEATAATALLLSRLSGDDGEAVAPGAGGAVLLSEVAPWPHGDPTVVSKASALIVVLSSGSLASVQQLAAIAEGHRHAVHTIAVRLPGFALPSAAFCETVLGKLWPGGDVDEARSIVQDLLAQQAVVVDMRASDRRLLAQCREVAERLSSPPSDVAVAAGAEKQDAAVTSFLEPPDVTFHEEFVEGCMNLRGPAKSVDLHKLSSAQNGSTKRLGDCMKSVDGALHTLVGLVAAQGGSDGNRGEAALVEDESSPVTDFKVARPYGEVLAPGRPSMACPGDDASETWNV